MNPIGGTELQVKLLQKHIEAKLLDNFQFTTSVPEKIPLAKDKINILWLQNNFDQPNYNNCITISIFKHINFLDCNLF